MKRQELLLNCILLLGYTILAFYAYCKCIDLLEREEQRIKLRIVHIPVQRGEDDDRLS